MPLQFLSPRHPIWLAGFRPFFILALIMGMIMPFTWGLVFSGYLRLPLGMNPLQWHAHEMFFGFAGAVLIGFLLTASKNWVKVRGIHGLSLMTLAGLWIFERFFIYFASDFHPLIKHIGLSLFIMASGLYVVNTLLKNRSHDHFKDNYFFIIILGLIVLSKNLLISDEYYSLGVSLTMGLFRLAFAVMFERTMPQFMKNTEGQDLYKNSYLNFLIKLLVLFSAFQNVLPPKLATGILALAASLLFVRWILWRPEIGFRKFGNATMYAGYMGLVLNLVFSVLEVSGLWSVGAIALHIFTVLCLGLVVPSMMIRISQGHTGRKPEFKTADKIAIGLIFISAIFRLLLPLLLPSQYPVWVLSAGLMWAGAYSLLGLRLIPFLFQPRVDGKEH